MIACRNILEPKLGNRVADGARAAAGLAVLFAAALFATAATAETAPTPIRIGFSNGMFTDVNENDARAAIKVWGQTIARQRGLPVEPEAVIYDDHAALRESLQNKAVDLVGITLPEYAALPREIRLSPTFVTFNSGRLAEQYVLLAHQNGPITNLTDLGKRSLTVHTSVRTTLAEHWLDTALLQQGLPPAAAFAGTITRDSKLTKVVLPVFFRQAGACVATRTGFDTMKEMNPQVGKQLKIIAASPEVIPTVFAFRAGYTPSFKEDIFTAIRELHMTPVGLQVLTIFQSERILDQPASCLDAALKLLDEHGRLIRDYESRPPQARPAITP